MWERSVISGHIFCASRLQRAMRISGKRREQPGKTGNPRTASLLGQHEEPSAILIPGNGKESSGYCHPHKFLHHLLLSGYSGLRSHISHLLMKMWIIWQLWAQSTRPPLVSSSDEHRSSSVVLSPPPGLLHIPMTSACPHWHRKVSPD